MLEFNYEALPARVVFGKGSLEQLPDEVARLGARKAMVLSTPGKRGLAEGAARRVAPRLVGALVGAVAVAAGVDDEVRPGQQLR